ncbi:hypothetical protein D3C71_2047870 [compost metagenome]
MPRLRPQRVDVHVVLHAVVEQRLQRPGLEMPAHQRYRHLADAQASQRAFDHRIAVIELIGAAGNEHTLGPRVPHPPGYGLSMAVADDAAVCM